ncbi:aspartic peptidase domain-containing protein [Helicostylum pulchrum]|nr:aspartic peptidase domain-containing protein [Helicostylum pulchrum]
MLLTILLFAYVNASSIILPITKRHKPINGLQKRAQHYTPLFNDEGSEYLVNIGIGTPIQNFTLSLDTGSADLWIPSIECPTDQCPLTRFDASKSSTFHPTTSLFHVQYGIGSVNGTYGTDHVYLGDAHVPQQLFGLASSTRDLILVTSNNTNEIANGIFGLGHPALTTSAVKYEPFLFQLAKQGMIDDAIFSISMGSMSDEGWSGEMMIGGTNPNKYSGEIEYAPVMSDSTYWMVGGKSIQILKRDTVDEIVLNSTFDGVRGMIIDTGTTLTYVDHELAEEIVREVAGREENNVALDHMSGTFIINCQAPHLNDRSVDYSVKIILENDVTLNIPVKDLIIPLDGKTVQESTQCMFGIAPWMKTGTSDKMNKKGWILIGDSVLRSTYLVFDMKQNRIGFAKPLIVPQQRIMVSLGNKSSPPLLVLIAFILVVL